MKGQKNPRKCQTRCNDHTFSLKPLNKDTYFKSQTTVQFCPKPNKHQSTDTQNIYPEYNNDGKVYTPAFILGIDRMQYAQNQHGLVADHLRKIAEYRENQKEILFPKPSRKHKICSVCRCSYEDYREHIFSKGHKRQIANSRFNSEILSLCSELFGNKPMSSIIIDEEAVQSTATENRPGDLVQPRPVKRLRLDEQNIPLENQPIMPSRPILIPNELMGYSLFGCWNYPYNIPPFMPAPFYMGYPSQWPLQYYGPYEQMYLPLPHPFLEGGRQNPIVIDS